MAAPKPITDGIIKFRCDWVRAKAVPLREIKTLNTWRERLYSLGLIGVYPTGIGFGNVSVRRKDAGTFLITGSATGNLRHLNGRHFTRVVDFNLDENSLTCKGPIKASSESLSHAVVYESNKAVSSVMHVHNLALWKKFLGKAPTTSAKAEYGTPEMAREIERLLEKMGRPVKGFMVMGGHKEGVLVFGRTPDEAGKILLEYLR